MSFQSFTLIEAGKALLRFKSGVLKETTVYHRGEELYVPHSGGYIRIGSKLGDCYTTSHFSVKVLDLEVIHLVQDKLNPVYRPAPEVTPRKRKAAND